MSTIEELQRDLKHANRRLANAVQEINTLRAQVAGLSSAIEQKIDINVDDLIEYAEFERKIHAYARNNGLDTIAEYASVIAVGPIIEEQTLEEGSGRIVRRAVRCSETCETVVNEVKQQWGDRLPKGYNNVASIREETFRTRSLDYDVHLHCL